ncbi:MAG TPA: PEP-CTERM sorting domain-containing protein, partial [Isosphaeraceae bacterium]|nr:PEP-CTERM sorting domain-containing protein [Isosphaeraceae bacterium]
GVISIDENGNSNIGPGFFSTDPGPGGLPGVLTYTLPFPGVQGDVVLLDAGVTLDVIRFNGNGTALFYSDNTDGFDSKADTPSPPGQLYANVVRIPEVGPEGNNGATYTPLPGQPGFDPTAAVTYNFVSDGSLPEPSSLVLLSSGFGLLGLGGWMRARKRPLS